MNSSIARAYRTEFFAAGGEMGRRMRDFEWSRTPLGPPASWPQSLRTAVQNMLGSRYAMWMGWGAGADIFLQRRVRSDARDQVSLGPGQTLARGLEGNLERHRSSNRRSRDDWARYLRPGPPADSSSLGISRADRPSFFLQSVARRRRRHRRTSFRGRREHVPVY